MNRSALHLKNTLCTSVLLLSMGISASVCQAATDKTCADGFKNSSANNSCTDLRAVATGDVCTIMAECSMGIPDAFSLEMVHVTADSVSQLSNEQGMLVGGKQVSNPDPRKFLEH